MPCWYYEKTELSQTPSIVNGMSFKQERAYRRESAGYIMKLGLHLKLHYSTIATACTFFHRFYMFHTFKEYPRFLMATAALFLAGKVEETPKKWKVVWKAATEILKPDQMEGFGDFDEKLLTHERILLQAIQFDLIVEHPHSYIPKFAKSLKGDRSKVEKLVQAAWSFANDSLKTTVCLEWEPPVVAVAFLELAGKFNKVDLKEMQGLSKDSSAHWFDYLFDDISDEVVEDICHQILDLYADEKNKSGDCSKNKVESKKKMKEVSQKSKFSSASKRNKDSSTVDGPSSAKKTTVSASVTSSGRDSITVKNEAPNTFSVVGTAPIQMSSSSSNMNRSTGSDSIQLAQYMMSASGGGAGAAAAAMMAYQHQMAAQAQAQQGAMLLPSSSAPFPNHTTPFTMATTQPSSSGRTMKPPPFMPSESGASFSVGGGGGGMAPIQPVNGHSSANHFNPAYVMPFQGTSGHSSQMSSARGSQSHNHSSSSNMPDSNSNNFTFQNYHAASASNPPSAASGNGNSFKGQVQSNHGSGAFNYYHNSPNNNYTKHSSSHSPGASFGRGGHNDPPPLHPGPGPANNFMQSNNGSDWRTRQGVPAAHPLASARSSGGGWAPK